MSVHRPFPAHRPAASLRTLPIPPAFPCPATSIRHPVRRLPSADSVHGPFAARCLAAGFRTQPFRSRRRSSRRPPSATCRPSPPSARPPGPRPGAAHGPGRFPPLPGSIRPASPSRSCRSTTRTPSPSVRNRPSAIPASPTAPRPGSAPGPPIPPAFPSRRPPSATCCPSASIRRFRSRPRRCPPPGDRLPPPALRSRRRSLPATSVLDQLSATPSRGRRAPAPALPTAPGRFPPLPGPVPPASPSRSCRSTTRHSVALRRQPPVRPPGAAHRPAAALRPRPTGPAGVPFPAASVHHPLSVTSIRRRRQLSPSSSSTLPPHSAPARSGSAGPAPPSPSVRNRPSAIPASPTAPRPGSAAARPRRRPDPSPPYRRRPRVPTRIPSRQGAAGPPPSRHPPAGAGVPGAGLLG